MTQPRPGKKCRPKQPDYGNYARFYDYFELAGREESEELNIFLDELFKINGIKTVVDLACGTGAQSIGLARKGYKVTAADLSPEMLAIAKKKAGKRKINFIEADMRTVEFANADAVICIFNAIGHLSNDECENFFCSVYEQLNPGGLFVFDILNFTAMQTAVFDEYRSMSREAIIEGLLVQHARQCTLNKKNRQIEISSNTRWQDGTHKPGQLSDRWTMQIFEVAELELMLDRAGFNERVFFGPTGSEFEPTKSDSILAVCQKPVT